ncbi:hypothetical protein [Paenibacillus humicola]|uniref:hypothetical protein n=1 Tax=Paenibacillus humicola TaxID=3110540 RepID=UPI00237A2FC6|nr:hypothetical protein [Paenibacillus humicola]
MDYSVLLWPLYLSKNWPTWKARLAERVSGDLLERMELYWRAKWFNDVFDVLADYVEAEQMPDTKERTQRRAKAIQLRVYPEYRSRYAR